MEESRRDESTRAEKSREEMEKTRNVGKKEGRKQAESNRGKKVFWM